MAVEVGQGGWLDALVDDLELPARSDLRQFLRDVGSDVTNGRAAMVPLIRLHGALEPNAGLSGLANAVSGLEKLGSGQGRMGRAAAARVVLSRSEIDDRRLWDFALQEVRADRDLLGIEPAIVGGALLRWRPDLLVESLAEESPMQKAVEAALQGTVPEELVNVLAVVPGASAAVLPSRPDLLEHASFWRIANVDASGLIRSLDIDQDHAARIVNALAEAARDDCSRTIVDCFGISPVVAALSKMDVVGIRSRMAWVCAIAQRANELAERMADGSSEAAMRTIEFATLDKTEIAVSFGCRAGWHQGGRPETIAADMGAAFVNDNFKIGCAGLHARLINPPGGVAKLRSRIERVFGTFATHFVSRFRGRTHSSPVQRGDYNAEAEASLTDHDLLAALVTYIVDIYHKRKHRGIHGETPADCWDRLVEKYGLPAPVDGMDRRAIFGVELERDINGRGVRVFGADFACEELRHAYKHSHQRKARLRFDQLNLGWIAVEIDGTWYPAHDLSGALLGTSFYQWSVFAKTVRD
ncbi:MAG: hypothetical protein ACK5LJ_09380, partial [Paracoccus sp. (in: a-proteobacteria)]